jgi:hypothetical protein
MINYSFDVIVNRPVSDVFRLASDVRRFDDWTDMSGTHLLSGDRLDLGSQFATMLRSGPVKNLTFEVTALDENRRMGFKTVSKGPLQWDAEYTFQPDGEAATRVTSSGQIRLKGWLRLLEPVMGGEVKKGEAKEIERFKALAERAKG